MIYPKSFSTICTQSCKQELIGFLLSLSIHHRNAKVYVICDTATKHYIEQSTPEIMLDICWKVDLDKYSNMNRTQMERNGMWSEFQMAKADVITFALETSEDTLFLDSDTIILDTLELPSNTKQLGVSPQFIKKKDVDNFGLKLKELSELQDTIGIFLIFKNIFNKLLLLKLKSIKVIIYEKIFIILIFLNLLI